MTSETEAGGSGDVARDATGALLRSRRFLPLLATQTLTSFIDNLIKNASGVLMLFTLPGLGPSLLALGGGVFMLPYILFSALAGELADRFEKALLLRITQGFAVLLAAGAALALAADSVTGQLLTLCGLGAQAAFFSPLKYGILPELLAEHELVAGNGLIEAGTFIGIVTGTTVGGMLVLAPHGTLSVGLLGIALAGLGVASAFGIARGRPAAPGLRIRRNILASTVTLVRQAWAVRPIRLSILGLAWFWTLGLVVLAELPVVGKDVLGGGEHAVTLLLSVFSVGVGVGSILCARLLHGDVSPRYVPLAGIGLSVFIAEFATASHALAAGGPIGGAWGLLAGAAGWRVLADLLALAVCGGIFSVPLYAILQARSDPAARSRMVAANNIVNAVFMVIGAGLAALLAQLGVSATQILLGTAALNLLVTLWVIRFAWGDAATLLRGARALAARLRS